MIFENELKEFYAGKRVLITGVHGFKGSWLAQALLELGADVYGYGLAHYSNDENSDKLFRMLNLARFTTTVEGDITNVEEFQKFFDFSQPDVVIHMAAQPLVSLGYEDPILTYSSNVMGTVSVLNAIRATKKKVSVISVTTDKVYFNSEKPEGYVEDDALKGYDPYSNSKSCAELASYSFNQSYFVPTLQSDAPIIMSTVRAGNVIGGGDFSENRIIPDMARALTKNGMVKIRNLQSIRPYQHVLDAVMAYAIIAMKQYGNTTFASEYNIGPNSETVLTTEHLVAYFMDATMHTDVPLFYEVEGEQFKETSVLLLDSTKMRETFDWAPVWGTKNEILSETYSWYDEWVNEATDSQLHEKTIEQIRKFLNV